MVCSDISAVIVTKGDHDLTPILESLPFDDVVVWDNSKERDCKVYGRFAGIPKAQNRWIYVQDDDCIVPARELASRFIEGRSEILCNVQKSHSDFYRALGCTLIGWGAIFPREMVWSAFQRYLRQFPLDDLFQRECDRVFTALSRFREVDLGVEHLPHALGQDRMGTEARHGADLREILRRVDQIRKAA